VCSSDLLHNPPPEVWQNDEVFLLLQRLKSEGKIRLSGVSISGMDEGMELVRNHKVDCLQVLMNVFNQEPAQKLLPFAAEHGVAVIVRVPLASGLLTGKYALDHRFGTDDVRSNYLSPKRMNEMSEKISRFQEIIGGAENATRSALSFLLKFPAISVVIPGAKTAAQVQQNAEASRAGMEDRVFENLRAEFSGYNFFLRYHVRV